MVTDISLMILGLTIVGVVATRRHVLPAWATLPLLVVGPLAVVAYAVWEGFNRANVVAPLWAVGTYWALYTSMGTSWALLGLALWRSAEVHSGRRDRTLAGGKQP